MADEGGYGGVLDGGISRARFLKLAGLGAGLSLFPGSLFSAGPGMAQVVGTPELLDPTKYPYPIAAWWPPPPVENNNPENLDPVEETERRYAELAGAGFNTAIGGNGVGNLRANRLALTACENNDVRLVLADNELSNAIKGTTTPAQSAQAEAQEEPEGVLQALTEQDSRQDVQAQAAANREAITQRLRFLAAEFGARRGLAGIFLYDEPGRTLFADLRFARQQVEEIFGLNELPYVNAWPSYADQESALQAPSYTQYLDSYMNGRGSISPPFLSFDHYPLLPDEKTTPNFFYNHAVIRRFAKESGVPSWGFVQSVGFDGLGLRRRKPDQDEIFWQINVALAYGVKGIQYFTYWTPQNPDVAFGDALITRDGAQTDLYGYARQANEFLRKVGAVLRPLDSEFVTHFGEKRLPPGAKPFKGYPSYVKAASGDAAILGLFKESDASTERYLLVVNRSPNRASTTRLTISGTVRGADWFDPSIEAPEDPFVRQPLTGDPPRFLNVSLGAGRARLYRLRTA